MGGVASGDSALIALLMKVISIRWIPVLISLLIVASGSVASCTLTRVDQELRVIYAEYTLAAIDLGHVYGELIRYRTAVIRATEADTQQDYERIADSLPQKRARIEAALERFVQASNDASVAGRMDARELTELKVVREKLGAYIVASATHHSTVRTTMADRFTSGSRAVEKPSGTQHGRRGGP